MSESSGPRRAIDTRVELASGATSPPVLEAPAQVSDPTSLPPPPGLPPKRWRTVVVLILASIVLAGGVAAITLGKGGTVRRNPSASPASRPEPQRVDPPAKLTAEPGTLRVLLRWKAPQGAVSLYRVTRNGDPVAVLRGRTRWLDTDVLPTTRYRYVVQTLDSHGVASEPAAIVVKTPAAPLALARVQGVYDVTMTIESKFGISSFPGPANTGWRFAPVCGRGACDVEWRDTNAHELTTRLRRTEATYSGSDAGRFNLACQQTPVVSSLTLTLHVVRAKVVGNTWRATVLEGHVTQREDAQLGCSPSGIDYTARAVLYR